MKGLVWTLGILFVVGAIFCVFDGISGAQSFAGTVPITRRDYWLGFGLAGLAEGGLRAAETVAGFVCFGVGFRFIRLAGRMS